MIRNHQVTGDATGGDAELRINMDDRFCSLISFFSASVGQTVGQDTDVRVRIADDAAESVVPTFQETRTLTGVSTTIDATTVGFTWGPPPQILPSGTGYVAVQFTNTDVWSFAMNCQVYLFNIRVRELSPMGPLLWARGST